MLCANRFVRFERAKGCGFPPSGQLARARGRHCEEHHAKSPIADFLKKRRSNPGTSAAIVGFNPGSLAMTAGIVPPSSGLRPPSPRRRGEKGAKQMIEPFMIAQIDEADLPLQLGGHAAED
jgi:hypothetical protein